MLEVGCPEPAAVLERIESTRNWAARSATVPRSVSDAEAFVGVVMRIAAGDRAVVTASGRLAYPIPESQESG
jgi:hypothetical protein